MVSETKPTPSAFEVQEKPAYNPPATVRQNHAPPWLSTIMNMFRGSVRPENQRFFTISENGSSGGDKPGHYKKSIMKRRRLRDIARESRRRNRAA